MIFHILRETPDNSGLFVMTGETLDTSGEVAINRAADLSGGGGRFAVYPFDAVRRDAPAVQTPAAPAAPVETPAAPDAPAQ